MAKIVFFVVLVASFVNFGVSAGVKTPDEAEVNLEGRLVSSNSRAVARLQFHEHSYFQRGLPFASDLQGHIYHLQHHDLNSLLGDSLLPTTVVRSMRVEGTAIQTRLRYHEQETLLETEAPVRAMEFSPAHGLVILLESGELILYDVSEEQVSERYETPCRGILSHKIQLVDDLIYCAYHFDEEFGHGIYQLNLTDRTEKRRPVLSLEGNKTNAITSFFVLGDVFYVALGPSKKDVRFRDIGHRILVLRGEMTPAQEGEAPSLVGDFTFESSGRRESLVPFRNRNYELYAFDGGVAVFRSMEAVVFLSDEERSRHVHFTLQSEVEPIQPGSFWGIWGLREQGENLNLIVGRSGFGRDPKVAFVEFELSKEEVDRALSGGEVLSSGEDE